MAEQIVIQSTDSRMWGVGRLADGRAAFVPGALPGEKAQIAITKDAGRYVQARLLAVEDPSAVRAQPFCPLYGQCGGCAAQHAQYSQTLAMKRTAVTDAFERIAGCKGVEVLPVIGMRRPFAYRNKVEFAVSQDGSLGFARATSHDIVPAAQCPLPEAVMRPAIEAVSRWLRGPGKAAGVTSAVFRSTGEGACMAVLCAPRPAPERLAGLDIPDNLKSLYWCRLAFRPTHALDGVCTRVYGQETLQETLYGLRFALSPQAFFQINREQCERMLRLVAEVARRLGGDVLDAYCGVGALSLAMAREAAVRSVTGLEIVRPAVENARANASANGLAEKARFLAGDAALTLPREIQRGERYSLIVVDPPRKGVDAPALDAILRAAPETILYVSCNPATLARDVKALAPQYAPERIQPLDLFPWTEHVETVCTLAKGK